MSAKLLLIDNYDSFTYNLVQAFLVLGADVRVYRNDAITVEQAQELEPTHLCISPGPGTPAQAGVSMDDDPRLRRPHPGVRRLPRPSVHRRGLRRQGGACRAPHAWQDLADRARRRRVYSMKSAQGIEVGRYHSLIAEAATHALGAVGDGAHAGGRDHGRAPRRTDGGGRAVSSRERADPGRPADDAEFPALADAACATRRCA